MGKNIATAFIGYKAAQAMATESTNNADHKTKKSSFLSRVMRRKAVTA